MSNLVDVDKLLAEFRKELAEKTAEIVVLEADIKTLERIQARTHHTQMAPPTTPIRPKIALDAEIAPRGQDAPIQRAFIAAFRETHGPVRVAELKKRVRERGVRLSKNSTSEALRRLQKHRLIIRRERGLYELVNGNSAEGARP